MNRVPMLDNILAQPESHRGVLALQHKQQATLRACAEKIRATPGRVIFTGMGGSLFATTAAVTRLAQHGYAAEARESSELLHYGSASLRAGDLGIVISRSGGSIEPVLLAEKMRQVGMTVIAVTNVPGSRLEEIADITLAIGSLADNLIAVQTYTGTVLTLLVAGGRSDFRQINPAERRVHCGSAGACFPHRRIGKGERRLATAAERYSLSVRQGRGSWFCA